jgi:hypothetical protein
MQRPRTRTDEHEECQNHGDRLTGDNQLGVPDGFNHDYVLAFPPDRWVASPFTLLVKYVVRSAS